MNKDLNLRVCINFATCSQRTLAFNETNFFFGIKSISKKT